MTFSGDNKMYNKTDNMNELVLLMQDTDEGISLQDIMKK